MTISFLLSKYRRFYGDSDAELMQLSARRFFAYVDNIPKLEAEESIRQSGAMAAAFGGDRSFIDRQFEILMGKEEAKEGTPDLFMELGLGYEDNRDAEMKVAFTKAE